MICICTLTQDERRSADVRDMLALAVYEPSREGNLERALALYDRDDHELLCAGLNRRPVSMLGWTARPEHIEIVHLATAPAHRHRNIARKLIRHLTQLHPDCTLQAETDGDAVGFYAACGFTCRSLGPGHGGIERFACTLAPPPPIAGTGSNVRFETLDPSRIDDIAPLWTRLNDHHRAVTLGWSDHFATFTFDQRRLRLTAGEKRLRIDVARDRATGAIVGYSIASIGANGAGEIESIYVEPAFRSTGTGDRLARNNLAWLEDNEVNDISLVVAVGNENALPFYEHLGFIPRTYVLKRRAMPSQRVESPHPAAPPGADT